MRGVSRRRLSALCAVITIFHTHVVIMSCARKRELIRFATPDGVRAHVRPGQTRPRAAPVRRLRVVQVSEARLYCILGGRPMSGTGIGMLCTQYQGGLLCALLAAARRAAQRFRILC